MKALLVLIGILLVLSGCGSDIFVDPVNALEYKAEMGRGACASGYTRRTPNFCQQTFNSPGARGAWTNQTVCTSRTFYTGGAAAVPSTATQVLILIEWQATGNGAAGVISNGITFYNTAGCSGWGETYTKTVFRVAAIGAGTVFYRNTDVYLIPVTGTNTFDFTQSTLGGNGTVDISGYSIVGYYD